MAFELKPDESVGRGMRRILRKQIENAIAQLTGPDAAADETVHRARKRTKRMRATLRLGRGALRPGEFRRANLALRDAARPLTEARDAAVLTQTLDKLTAAYPGEVPAGEVDRARNVLAERAAQARRRVIDEGQAPAHVAAALGDAQALLARLRPRGKGWSMLAPGLRRVYRDGRRAFAVAVEQPTDENLHEWRKQTKHLWHALEILHACAPVIVDRLAEHAHQLNALLGDDHDLAVLHQTLPAADFPNVLTAAQRRRAELQQASYAMGERVYADRPAAFVKNLGRRFRRWRAGARAM